MYPADLLGGGLPMPICDGISSMRRERYRTGTAPFFAVVPSAVVTDRVGLYF